MIYEGTVYRPPSEYDSLILQATLGCPHNKCHFCNMYRNKSFRIKKPSQLLKEIQDHEIFGGLPIKKVFIADGNSLIMKTEDLVLIIKALYKKFSGLEQVTIYGSSLSLSLKSHAEFKALRAAGLTHIHCGMESANNETLAFINKGGDQSMLIDGCLKAQAAGISLCLYYIIGLGGLPLSRGHAIDSAKAINLIQPDFVRLRTLLALEGTEIYQKVKAGTFRLLNAHECLDELSLLLRHLKPIHTQIVADHISNHLYIEGQCKDDLDQMLKNIEASKKIPLSQYRNPEDGCL